MIEIRKTELFAKWLDGLRDIRARARILVRIERLAQGNSGDTKSIGEGVSEMRIDYGPGYRVYFKMQGLQLVLGFCKTLNQAQLSGKMPCKLKTWELFLGWLVHHILLTIFSENAVNPVDLRCSFGGVVL